MDGRLGTGGTRAPTRFGALVFLARSRLSALRRSLAHPAARATGGRRAGRPRQGPARNGERRRHERRSAPGRAPRARSTRPVPRATRRCRSRLGVALIVSRQHSSRRIRAGPAELEEALTLHRTAGDELGVRRSLQLLGNLSIELDDYTGARRILREVVESARADGNLFQAAAALHSLADAELEAGATGSAIELYEEALTASRELGAHRISCFCLAGLSAALAVRGDAISAAKLWSAVLQLEEILGFRLRSRARYERRIRPDNSPPSRPTSTDPELVIKMALPVRHSC